MLFSSIRTSKPIVCQETGKIIGTSEHIEFVIDEQGNIDGIEIKKRLNLKQIIEYIKWEDIIVIGEDVIIVKSKEVN